MPPAIRKATGVPPLASDTAKPSTAKMPPPTMPPMPMDTASRNPIWSLAIAWS